MEFHIQVQNPWGPLWLSGNEFALTRISWSKGPEKPSITQTSPKWASLAADRIEKWLNLDVNDLESLEIQRFEKPLSIPVELPAASTNFQREVLNALVQTKTGSTISYKRLGELAGFKNAARGVGSVMSRNQIPLLIPCHRVVPAQTKNGELGNYNAPGGSALKQDLLRRESCGALAIAVRFVGSTRS